MASLINARTYSTQFTTSLTGLLYDSSISHPLDSTDICNKVSRIGYPSSVETNLLVSIQLPETFQNREPGMASARCLHICGETTARNHGITREDQDEYSTCSYRCAQQAWKGNGFAEIATVTVIDKGKEGLAATAVVAQKLDQAN